MLMKKVNEHIYEFFNLEYVDPNLEITNLKFDDDEPYTDFEVVEDNFYWFDKYLESFDFDYIMELERNNYNEMLYETVIVKQKPKSKKDELLENLHYLNSKKNKSKKDKESIYMLEMILKNM